MPSNLHMPSNLQVQQHFKVLGLVVALGFNFTDTQCNLQLISCADNFLLFTCVTDHWWGLCINLFLKQLKVRLA